MTDAVMPDRVVFSKTCAFCGAPLGPEESTVILAATANHPRLGSFTGHDRCFRRALTAQAATYLDATLNRLAREEREPGE